MMHLNQEDHTLRAAALSTILTNMLGDLMDGGVIEENLYVLSQEIQDHLQVATAPNLERIAALDAAASR